MSRGLYYLGIALLVANPAHAQSLGSVFVEQVTLGKVAVAQASVAPRTMRAVGTDSQFTVIQNGDGNRVGATAAVQTGGPNIASITQTSIGGGNTADFSQHGSNALTLNQSGAFNAHVSHQRGEGNVIVALQQGAGNSATVHQAGDGHLVRYSQIGSGNFIMVQQD